MLRKLRGFAAFSGLLMAFGFLALFGAIGYRVMVGWKSAPTEIGGTILLPKGASVVSAVPSGDLLAVTVEQADGTRATLFFDAASKAPRGRIGYAQEP